jgi:serine/threonine protein kinase
MTRMSFQDDSRSDLDFGPTLRGFAANQRLFDRYVLREILGRGGMGVVWRAHDEQLECEVALKFLPEMVAFDEQAVAELKRETRKTRELRHHHIVQVYDFVTDKRSACISMEWVDGPTLSAIKARKESGCMEVDEITEWVKQLCEALSYAHERAKIVHRDLKPANLMINGRSELKVTDFGIARSVSDSVSMLTMTRGTSGTLVYMSPQQLDGERTSHLDDIYSLGATLYELLTSKPPFHSGGIEHQIHEKTVPSVARRREELNVVGGQVLPPQWETTIAACLAKDPTQRPQSAAEIGARLGLRSTSFTSTAPAVTPSALASTKKHRTNVPALVFASLAVLSFAALAYYSWRQRSTLQPQQSAMVVTTPAPASQPTPPAAATPQSVPNAEVPSVEARLLKEATELREKGDTSAALERLQKAVKSDPKNANALAQMAMIYESIQLFERANETWHKIQEIGPSAAGALYELADMKLKNGATAPTTSPTGTGLTNSPLDPNTAHNDADGIPDGSTFGITEVTATDTSEADSEKMKLKIAVKSRPNTPVDNTKVRIQVFFYDTLDGKEGVLTDADVSYEWLTPRHDWKDTNPEILAVTYLRPKKKNSADLPGTGSHRKYLGYIVRVYYNDQLQGVRAEPTRLLNLFPPPFTYTP